MGRWLPLLFTPEVRRLSQIRLLNTLTPSLATLGELRRYSHTLGVLFLFQSNRQHIFSPEECDALGASVILHDIGTPPFGHLFEYHLREMTGWNHESIIKAILWGFHAPENKAHQIFGGRQIQVLSELRRSGISIEIVQAIVTRAHPLSQLLFGSLDLDNLDNVARMAWALGMKSDPAILVNIAANITVTRDGVLQLSERRYGLHIRHWAGLRRRIYDILVFDPPTVAAQAVLSEAIEIGLRCKILTEADWDLYDEVLIEKLRSFDQTKRLISRDYLGDLPKTVFALQLSGALADYQLDSRSVAKEVIEDVLSRCFGKGKALAYVFIDGGTFEKRVDFVDPDTGRPWAIGESSKSVVLYAFHKSVVQVTTEQATIAADAVIAALKLPGSAIMRLDLAELNKENAAGDDPQLAFPDF
jgi:HD superfamily phosphohydrolase